MTICSDKKSCENSSPVISNKSYTKAKIKMIHDGYMELGKKHQKELTYVKNFA